MTDEVDFALKYAAERKQRMALEQRVNAFIFETVPFVNATIALIHSFLTNKPKASSEIIKRLVSWQSDMEVMTLINIYQPAGSNRLLPTGKLPTTNGAIPEETLEHIHEIVRAASKTVHEEWHQFAQNNEEVPCLNDLRRINNNCLRQALKKNIEAQHSAANGEE